MILKIGRTSRVDDSGTKSWTWEYVDGVDNVVVKSCETPLINLPDLCEVTDVGYYLRSPNSRGDNLGECHNTTLSGEDCCYLMNDEGKTIEVIRR